MLLDVLKKENDKLEMYKSMLGEHEVTMDLFHSFEYHLTSLFLIRVRDG